MKKSFPITLLSCLFILVTLIAYPVSGELVITPIKNTMHAGDTAVYEITLKNEGDTDQVYNIRLGPIDAARWISSPSNVAVQAGQERTFNFTLSSRSMPSPGSRGLSLRATSRLYEYNAELPLRILSQDQYLGYVPNVDAQLSSPDYVDPREPIRANIDIDNRNPRKYDNITVTIELKNDRLETLYSQVKTIQLDSLEDVQVEFIQNIDRYTSPGSYSLQVTLYDNEIQNTLSSRTEPLQIVAYQDIETQENTTSFWLKSTSIITVTNNGNQDAEYNLTEPTSYFKRGFISTNTSYNIVSDNQTLISWPVSLEPQSSTSIYLEYNYRGLFIATIIMATLVALYFILRSPVIIRKVAKTVSDGEGGYSEIKVTLSVLNRSGAEVHDVQILDYLPRITEYKQSKNKASLAPSKVSKTTKKGTILKWDLDTLEPSEERLVSYEMKSTLSIVGGVTLPKATARFMDDKNNRTDTVSSSPKVN